MRELRVVEFFWLSFESENSLFDSMLCLPNGNLKNSTLFMSFGSLNLGPKSCARWNETGGSFSFSRSSEFVLLAELIMEGFHFLAVAAAAAMPLTNEHNVHLRLKVTGSNFKIKSADDALLIVL